MKTIVLDPGHGGRDPGAAAHGLKEKDLALDLSLALRNHLVERYQVTIEMTREGDRFVPLGDRTTFANDLGADGFVSIHNNAAANAGANGVETFIHPAAPARTQEIGRQVHEAIARPWVNAGRADRGLKTANFYVLRRTQMPAILVELGFVTNARDAALLADAGFEKAQVEALAAGIAAAWDLQPREGGDPDVANWKVEQLVKELRELGALGYLHDVEMHVEQAQAEGTVDPYVWASILRRLAEKVGDRMD